MKLNEQINRMKVLMGLNPLNESLLNEGYFNPTLPEKVKNMRVKYETRNIDWYGTPGRSAIIPINLIDTMEGNIFDEDKLSSLLNQIKNMDENIELETAYCLPHVIEFINIKEEQESYHSGRFDVDYDGSNEPASIGDDDLDKYIASYHNLDDIIEDTDYAPDLFKKYHLDIATGKKTIGNLKSDFEKLMEENDDEYREYLELAIDEFLEYEKRVYDAIKNNEGDLNTMRFQMRDGNHRFTVAKELGERYILCDISHDYDIEEVKKFVKVI